MLVSHRLAVISVCRFIPMPRVSISPHCTSITCSRSPPLTALCYIYIYRGFKTLNMIFGTVNQRDIGWQSDNLKTNQLLSDDIFPSGGSGQCFTGLLVQPLDVRINNIPAKTSVSMCRSLFTVQLAAHNARMKICDQIVSHKK